MISFWQNINIIPIILLCFMFVNSVPWHEEKFSHKLKSLVEEEYKYIANINGTSNGIVFEDILDPFLIQRLPGSTNHTSVKEHIINHMTHLDWHIETDAFHDLTPFGVFSFENIVATLNPNTPRRLVLGCHYDSKNFTRFEFIGAIDSAVSCSMLLHFASVLKEQLEEHRQNLLQHVTLQFIFFDGEEAFQYWTDFDSIYGAKHLAAKWEAMSYPQKNFDNTTYLHRMDILILLDLLGSRQPQFHSMFNSTNHWYTELHLIELALRQSNCWSGSTNSSLYFKLAYDPFIVPDDHIPFLTRNVQILHMIAQPFPIVWHTERDTKNSLDFDSIDNLSRILRIFVSKYIHLPFLGKYYQ